MGNGGGSLLMARCFALVPTDVSLRGVVLMVRSVCRHPAAWMPGSHGLPCQPGMVAMTEGAQLTVSRTDTYGVCVLYERV